MAKKIKEAPTQVEANVGELFSRSERFIENYKNHVIIAVAAIIFLVVVIIGGRQYYLIPKEKEAQAAIFPGENLLASQEWDKALNGNGADYIGFLGIIDEYGITTTAKLAKAYAGICYYHLGDAENAKEYLSKFSVSDKILSPVISGLIGDCYIDLQDVNKGIEFFKKAATEANSEFISPIYLKKAGYAYESLGDFKNALEVYTVIKNKYSTSSEGMTIDKYIVRASSQLK
jgi:tetratricopeptide (TPR) repeat protein